MIGTVEGHIDMTREQVDGLWALLGDEPIHMLNLIRLRDVADYLGRPLARFCSTSPQRTTPTSS